MPFTGTLKSWRRSVAARLSLWFATLFTVGFGAIFALLYWTLQRHMEERDIEGLKLALGQYSEIYAVSGVAGLQQRVALDSRMPHVRSLFVRIVDPAGNALLVYVPPD
jgi:hypothetical protein